jgi:hypothetical protein
MKSALRIGFALALAAVSCSSSPDSSSGARSSEPGDGVGALHMQLVLPSGESIEVVSWALTGPSGASTVVQSGKVNSQSLGVSFLVGDIPAGHGYDIALSGTATDGSVTCTGSAPFDVASRTTTDVSVELACSVATGGSHVTLVNGTAFDCAGTNGIAASPTETTLGHSVSLRGMAAGPNPTGLSYQWSAPTGTFDQPTASATNFECTTAGPVTVTLVVGDGPVPSGQACSASIDTATAVITCDVEQPPPPDGGAPDAAPMRAPAMPPAAVASMAIAMLALGSRLTRRRKASGASP